jgi:hypothetical protein
LSGRKKLFLFFSGALFWVCFLIWGLLCLQLRRRTSGNVAESKKAKTLKVFIGKNRSGRRKMLQKSPVLI